MDKTIDCVINNSKGLYANKIMEKEMRKIKVLHMLCSNCYSGAENVICQIINMFKNDDRYEFIYASPNGPIKEALAAREIEFEPMVAASLGEFKRIIKDVKPDIIHAHDMRAGFLAAIACEKIPLISHIHNNNFDSQKPTVKAFLYRYAAIKAKHIFWVSQSSFEGYYFHKGLENKSTVLYNVIDSKQLKEKAKQATIKSQYDIVYIGRMTYQKNPQRLLEVLSLVIKERPETRCALIGTGDLEDTVKKIILEKQLNKNVDFLGFQSNPYGILENAKMMIMTSRWEGTPMCALEAMTLGIPIVSTPTDGLRELVKQGDTGFLEENDIILKERCIQIISDDSIRKSLAMATVARSNEMMDLNEYRSQLSEVYNKFS